MDPRLKGSQLPTPNLVSHPLNSKLLNQEGFQDIQTFYPGMGVICNLKTAPEEDLWLDHTFRIVSIHSAQNNKSSGKVNLQIERNTKESGVELQDISGFRKITHLLDPVRWLQGKYSMPKHSFLPWHQESWEAAWNKLQDPMNQAYVEALASYAFSRIREADLSPHYHYSYGSLCGKAETYAYNITDSYMTYRHARWFWTSQEKGLFKVSFDDAVPTEVREAIMTQPDELDSSSDEEESKSDSMEELSDLDSYEGEAGSIKSADDLSFHSKSDTDDSEETTDSEEKSDDDDDLDIFADVKQFPVMMIFTEASKGTMDELLDNEEEVGCEPGSEQWEITWTAWIFQVIAALSAAQYIFGFTHNDLHSNNLVWIPTEKQYLYYKTNDGLLFRVPTYGKIFRIIDFGRAIFKINSHMFFSDDFKKGNDAAEQFNFGEMYDSSESEVHPNPSFDLCRFSVSVFESLFPESPPTKKKGKILSEEPDLIIHESESELYNLMWTWLLCDNGHNVLMEADGSERYPDFDLYKVITSQAHNAVPADQVRKQIFNCFQVKSVEGEKVYSLFC